MLKGKTENDKTTLGADYERLWNCETYDAYGVE